MFDFKAFIKNNLVEGFKSGTFNEIQVNIFAMNYLSRGQIEQSDFEQILAEIELIKNPPITE